MPSEGKKDNDHPMSPALLSYPPQGHPRAPALLVARCLLIVRVHEYEIRHLGPREGSRVGTCGLRSQRTEEAWSRFADKWDAM